jgi:hypothetical protein
MTPKRRRPHGFYARLARAQHECDATLPWSLVELIRMDRAFCDAVRREIARGTERARGPVPKPPATRLIRRLHPTPRRSGPSSPAELCAEIGDRDRFW